MGVCVCVNVSSLTSLNLCVRVCLCAFMDVCECFQSDRSEPVCVNVCGFVCV